MRQEKRKPVGTKPEWKGVHALRKRNKKKWRMDRFASILSGDWGWYRSYKQELNPRHWWGRLLENKSSSEIAAEAQAHLTDKMWDANKTDWDDELEEMIAAVEKPNDFTPVLPVEVWDALEGMKAQAALGPDGVSVPLLKQLMHEQPENMCRLLQEHILHDELPAEWHDSFPGAACQGRCSGWGGTVEANCHVLYPSETHHEDHHEQMF